MLRKTYKTAVVLIPPLKIWAPIQAIRKLHDRHVRRWMPHITLIYPFRPLEEFEGLTQEIAAALAALEPPEVTLSRFSHFQHGPESFTLWLAPELPEPLIRLHEIVWRLVPDCDDVRNFPEGFAPHLSVGQARGLQVLESLRDSLEASWKPLSFTATEVGLISRGDPPDDVFRVHTRVTIGRAR